MLYDPYSTTNLGGVGSPAAGIPGAPGNLGGVGGPQPRGAAPMTTYTAQIDPQAQLLNKQQSHLQNVRNIVTNQGQKVTQALQKNKGLLMNRGALLGGATVLATGAIPGAIDAIQGDNPAGGAANLAATAGGLGLTGLAAKGIKNPLARLGVMAVGGLVSGIGGQVAEDAVGKVTGKGDSQGAQRTRALKDARTQAEVMGIMSTPWLNAQKELNQAAMEQRLTELQRSIPMYNQMKNADLVRQQALNASNAQNYMAMGTVATAGKLALGAQAEAGANLRTAMTANPYANSTLQAPNISF